MAVAEEAAAASIEEAGEEEAGVERQRPHNSKNDLRRKTSSISPSTWTSRSLSSSTEGEKVGATTVSDNKFMLILWQVIGTLKGYDQLMNLVLDDVKETLRGLSPV